MSPRTPDALSVSFDYTGRPGVRFDPQHISLLSSSGQTIGYVYLDAEYLYRQQRGPMRHNREGS